MSYDTLALMPPPSPEHFGAVFRSTYEHAGVTQVQIAKAVDVDQTTVSAWANGRSWPPIWAVAVVEELCDLPRGRILRLAGFVADDLDLSALSPDGRDVVLHVYDHCRRSTIEALIDADPVLTDENKYGLKQTYTDLRTRDARTSTVRSESAPNSEPSTVR